MNSIKIVLQYALDPNIKWLVGPDLPEFHPITMPGVETMLLAEARRLYLFVEGGHESLTQKKREMLFIQLLEMLSSDDVKLIHNIIQKKLPWKNIDYSLVKEAFPDILPDKTFQAKNKKSRDKTDTTETKDGEKQIEGHV